MKELAGVFAPITTPFKDGEVALDQLRGNMRRYRQTGLAGYFALGSNGEGAHLSEDEKLKALDVILEGKGERQTVMAGTGCESTRHTVAFSRKAASAGADCVSLLTPSYFRKRMTDEALVAYYKDVADASSIPVVAYNAPGFTGLTLSAGVVEKISAHPNIAGMKDSSKGNLSGYLSVAGPDFDILAGSVSTLYTGLSLGAKGGVVSLADAFPDICCRFYDTCRSGDREGALRLHYLLFRLNRSISGSYGVAGVKYAMQIGGYHGGDPRPPLLPLKTEDRLRIREALSQAGLAGDQEAH
jgi:4-hydroxy-2-oxoglutarate aldolase